MNFNQQMPGMNFNQQMPGMNFNPQMAQMNSMYGSQNNEVTNDQLIKLGIMAPQQSMQNLPMTSMENRLQSGGSNNNDIEYIDINNFKPNFFF